MTARIVLAAAALLVFGACLYLFLEVRATPPEALASAGNQPAPTPPPEADDSDPEADEPERTPPTRTAQVATTSEAGAPAATVRPSFVGVKAGGGELDPAAIDDSAIADPDGKPGYRLDAIMAEANKHYDRHEYDEARAIAQRVLKKLPTNVRMLRIMVSAACADGDQAEAQKHFNVLPERDREQMKTRCMRNQITFTDPPAPPK